MPDLKTNAVQDPRETLHSFTLDDLAPYTREGSFDRDVDPRYRLFFVGRDDVHGILKHIISRASLSFKLNQFGYDDEELDEIIASLVHSEHVYVQGTLDKSQAGGVHERKILAGWTPEMRTSFAVGNSATHQISHTKGGVLDGAVAYEGSTNWSASGEGTIPTDGTARKAQNNTLLVSADRVMCARFSAQLDAEHAVAVAQEQKAKAA